MAILNRILGIARGAATRRTAARPHATGAARPGMGASPGAGAGIPRSGRGLLSSLLNGRRRRPM